MESRHRIQPRGQMLRRLAVIASVACGAVLANAWWAGPGTYTWPMTVAVGTSLFVIAMKSAAGFAKYQGVLAEQGLAVDWSVVGTFVGVGVLGSFAGRAVGGRIPEAVLRRAFAAFLALVSLFVLVKSGSDLFAT